MAKLFKDSKKDSEERQKILSVLSQTGISAYTDVASVSILKSIDSINAFEAFLSQLNGVSDAIVSSIGKNSITLLLPQKSLGLAKNFLGTHLLDINESAGAIFLKCDKSVNITPGITAYISSLFSQKEVLIHDLISTYTDYVIIIHEKDAYMMADFLKKNFGC